MRLEILMAALMVASASTASPAFAATGRAEKVTVCHRTGSKSDSGRFVGHTITIGSSDAVNHIERHGDVKLSEYAKTFFTSSRTCIVDGQGNLFTDTGQPVSQTPPAPNPNPNPNGPSDPGGGGLEQPENPGGG